MKVKDLLAVLNSASSEADVFISVFLGDNEIDLEIENVEDLIHAVFIEPERLYITHKHETDMYIPKKSHNFTFNIFDPDSGETISKDIPLSDEKANEIIENYEKIKKEEFRFFTQRKKSEDKLN